MNPSNPTPLNNETMEMDFSGDEPVKFEEIYEASDEENIEDDEEQEVVNDIDVKTQNFILNSSTVSENADAPKYLLHEEMCKAIASRDNALAEYLIAKRNKLTISEDQQELCIAELKLKIKRVRLENLKLKADLQAKG